MESLAHSARGLELCAMRSQPEMVVAHVDKVEGMHDSCMLICKCGIAILSAAATCFAPQKVCVEFFWKLWKC